MVRTQTLAKSAPVKASARGDAKKSSANEADQASPVRFVKQFVPERADRRCANVVEAQRDELAAVTAF